MEADRTSVMMISASALQGILAASDSKAFAELGFGGIVNLAAEYGEALAKRLDNPPTED